MEFLGDSVLGLAVASYLYRRLEGEEEGRLAKLKAFVVSRTSCAEVARMIGLPGLVLHASPVSPEHREELVQNSTMLGNVLEALIGAAFLAFGFQAVAEPVAFAFLPRIDYALHNDVDYKSTLQEALAAQGRAVAYQLLESAGPAHHRTFTSAVRVDGQEMGRGMGRSIKRSEQVAALEALIRLGLLRRAEAGAVAVPPVVPHAEAGPLARGARPAESRPTQAEPTPARPVGKAG